MTGFHPKLSNAEESSQLQMVKTQATYTGATSAGTHTHHSNYTMECVGNNISALSNLHICLFVLHIHIHICVCISMHVYVCMYMYKYVCIHVCISMYIHV